MSPIGGKIRSDASLDHPPLYRCNLFRRRGKIGIIIFEALLFRARIFPYLESWDPYLESCGPILVATVCSPKLGSHRNAFKIASKCSEIAQKRSPNAQNVSKRLKIGFSHLIVAADMVVLR
eukprot:1888862-Prymnesium_polylepis.1